MRRGEHASDRDGFTLVEMLVTLTILGLAASVAFQFAGGSAFDRRAALLAGTVAAEIDRLRAEAIRSGRSGRLAFEPGTARFVSSRPGSTPIPAGPVQVSIVGGPPERPILGEIRLLPDGSSTGGRIVFAAAGSHRVLTVGSLTGRVRREDGP